jgi:hypothetical protein
MSRLFASVVAGVLLIGLPGQIFAKDHVRSATVVEAVWNGQDGAVVQDVHWGHHGRGWYAGYGPYVRPYAVVPRATVVAPYTSYYYPGYYSTYPTYVYPPTTTWYGNYGPYGSFYYSGPRVSVGVGF